MLPQMMPLPWTMMMIIMMVSMNIMYQFIKMMKMKESQTSKPIKANSEKIKW